MSIRSTPDTRVQVRITGSKLPYVHNWLYRIYRGWDGSDKIDSFTSLVQLTAQEMADVESYYSESLDGYVLGGVQLPRQEVVTPWSRQQRRRRMTRVAEDQS